MKLRIEVVATGQRGSIDTEAGAHVGIVTGPVVYDSAKGAPPVDEQVGTLSVLGLSIAEIRKLQGRRVAVFAVDEE